MKTIRLLLMITAVTALLTGCSARQLQHIPGLGWMGANDQVANIEQLSTITGQINNSIGGSGPIILIVLKINQDVDVAEAIVGKILLYGDGQFKFQKPAGKYFLLAFQDNNEDGTFQRKEIVGWHGAVKPLVVKNGVNVHGLTIEMRSIEESRQQIPRLYDLKLDNLPEEIPKLVLGKVVSLDNPIFTAENGKMGMWEPIKFMRSVDSGIYFLEPYNANKIPVLFVHGVGGNPHEWQTIAESLDREKFQPWFFYYPSGLRLPLLGSILSHKLQTLQQKYQFDKMAIVAHSMGGLVTREAINDLTHDHNSDFIYRYVTMSTPWQGHDLAATGVKHSPVIVPCWYDMSVGSPFLTKLFTSPLPTHIKYYLLFSYRGKSGMFAGENSDGVITLRSQLRSEAQQAAQNIYGFDASHVGILSDRQAITTLQQILAPRQ